MTANLLDSLRTFLAHYAEDDDTTVIEAVGNDELTVGMLRQAMASLDRPLLVVQTDFPLSKEDESRFRAQLEETLAGIRGDDA